MRDPELGLRDSELGLRDPEQGLRDPELGLRDPELGLGWGPGRLLWEKSQTLSCSWQGRTEGILKGRENPLEPFLVTFEATVPVGSADSLPFNEHSDAGT